MKLNVKKTKVHDPKRKVTQCPECGNMGIEWKLSGEFLRHAYTCPDCGYEGTVVLEVNEDEVVQEL